MAVATAARSLAAARVGLRRNDGYGVKTGERRGGFEEEAYGGCNGAGGKLGGGQERSGRRDGSPVTEEEEWVGDGEMRHVRSRGLTETM